MFSINVVQNEQKNYKKVFQKDSPPGGLEPPTFRLTAERASRLRHGGFGDFHAVNTETFS